MAELVAEAFLSALFEKLFEQLTSPELRKNSVASKLKELNGKLKKVRLWLDDAEDRQLGDKDVKEWLDELKHVVFMADDLVEEIINSKKGKRSKRKVVTGAFKSVYRSLAKTVQGEIDMISANLDVLSDRATVLGLKHGGGGGGAQGSTSSLKLITPLRDEDHVYGRNVDKEKIFDSLLSDDVWGGKIGVLPIVGMGGLGKTTLAQLVYEDTRVKEHGFLLKAWVTVSTEFDVVRIIKAVLQQVSPEALNDGVEEPTHLQRLVKEAVIGKRFLFVLDDVWNENYDNWDALMSHFTTGDCTSRVIVTTRSRDVGSTVKTGPIHELERVSDDDCWSIFFHHALNGDTDANPRLQEIGRRIVEKCKGLPLAVKSIGGLLRSERNPVKWETILKSHVWELSQSGVLPSLWLSYRYLPSSLKQCFAYCSLLPQDYEFRKKEMVLLWMAEGFLQLDGQNERRMEEVGEQYFDDLVSMSLIQRSSRYKSRFVMHDFVHDLAVFVSGEFCFKFENESVNLNCITATTRHLSHNTEVDNGLWNSLSKAKHLRTFMRLYSWNSLSKAKHLRVTACHEFVKKLITKGTRLRVLSLGTLSSHSVGDLKSLRYLNLSDSDIVEVPCSVCTLFNLQTLLLRDCLSLEQLPVDMKKLINLRHLDTTGTWRIRKMPPQMGNLKELQTVTNFVLGEAGDNGCSTIKELGEFQHLGGTLSIHKLQNVDCVEDVQKANLRDKGEIGELLLRWVGATTNTLNVLDALRPHTNLETLTIWGYSGSTFPIWISEPSFSKMVFVELSGKHDSCRSLPPLGQLPSLKELVIRSFHGVENISCEFYGNNSSIITPFPCLETLSFRNMECWKEWSVVGKENGCFPRLKCLRLIQCPKLDAESLLDCETLESLYIDKSYNSMECFPLDKFPRLERLTVEGCPNLKSLGSSTEDRLLPSLTYLKFEKCPEMESFPEGGLPLSLKSLIIVNCSKLVEQNRHWNLQQLTLLTSLTINDYDAPLDSFPDGLLPTS